MSTPVHIRMREIELGEMLRPRSKSIPIVHEDDVSGLRREPREKKSLYFYKFKYEMQSPLNSSHFVTKFGEKDIHLKCMPGLPKEDIDKMAYDKLESTFMSNDRLIDATVLFKKKVF